MNAKQFIFSNEKGLMPDIHFRAMSITIRAREAIFKSSNRLDKFGIEKGYTVIDYGCGPGAYVPKAAELVGEKGIVYAADIHPLAIEYVNKIIRQQELSNVKSVLVDEYHCPLPNDMADLIFLLDAFHMIQDPDIFLQEIHRLVKTSGVLFLDDGHQSRRATKQKITHSGLWSITNENKDHIKCAPIIRS